MVECSVVVKERMNNGRDVNEREYISYSHVQCCIDKSKSSSITDVAINENRLHEAFRDALDARVTHHER
ncbi:hypothetical protein VNO78_00527 [Psophocarpus tetragonolobus]|uniref:Uncharacterized protein n=1 Tax=Psophocarpus tetragonolobus TaxID=3891 RepID=A0AAN9SY65_PSOTE